jgi:PAS domain S-box-containing protein
MDPILLPPDAAAAGDSAASSDRSYRAIFEVAGDAICVLDPASGEILDANPALCTRHGYTLDEVRRVGIREISVDREPYTLERLLVHLQRAARGEPQRFEWRSRTRRGDEVLWEAHLARLALHGRDRLLVVARDITERKRADEALRASEESYRTLFDATADAICVYDPDTGAILDTNRANCELHGYTAEEIRALGIERLNPNREPYTMERAWGYLARAAAGEPQRFEWATVTRWGDEIVWDTHLLRASLRGRPVLMTVSRDIREQKRVDEALRRANAELEHRVEERTAELREREEYFRRLAENSHDLVQIIGADGVIQYSGPSMHRLLGYTPEEVAGTLATDYIHPEDLPRVADTIAAAVGNPGVTHRAQYRVLHKDGEYRHNEGFARTLAIDSAERGLVANVRDVTERVRAEEALKEREEHFRSLIENAHDSIAIVDAAGVMRYQSPAMERLMGYAPDEMDGRPVVEFLHPEDVQRVVETLRAITRFPGSTGAVDYRFRHKDGSWRMLEAFGRTLRPDSAEEGVVVNVRDVTERRRAEEALIQAKAEAERANREKSEFLSRMSHELRTPLNSILGFAQILADVELDPADRKAVHHILTAGEHLLTLINEVLDIARIESGRQPLSLEPVRLGVALREAVSMVRPLAAARGVWVAEAPAGLGDAWVHADRQRLVQVLLNLLSNAVKYNRPGGSVRLACEPASGGGPVRVRVVDSGLGIAAEQRGRLFVPFARLGAEQTGIEGTGLGLALSRRLVEAMGGTLDLEASSPEGSTFRVELRPSADPLGDAAAEARHMDPAQAEPLATATLLYVEDNLANLNLVEMLLSRRPGWRLIPALQGGLGVELAREHAPDVVLLDLHLPDMPGEEVLRQLRADPRTAGIPVIVISADATPRTIERLQAAGADEYITKPLNVKRFVEAVNAMLAGAASP